MRSMKIKYFFGFMHSGCCNFANFYGKENVVLLLGLYVTHKFSFKRSTIATVWL